MCRLAFIGGSKIGKSMGQRTQSQKTHPARKPQPEKEPESPESQTQPTPIRFQENIVPEPVSSARKRTQCHKTPCPHPHPSQQVPRELRWASLWRNNSLWCGNMESCWCLQSLSRWGHPRLFSPANALPDAPNLQIFPKRNTRHAVLHERFISLQTTDYRGSYPRF